MSDPIFLRSNISGTVYAEQINSAQIQAQAAARERATRIRQEALKDEQAMISRLEEAATVDIKDEEDNRERHAGEEQAFQENAQDAAQGPDEEQEAGETEKVIRHIDFTV